MSKRYVHIGSWNVEHFSKANDGNDENVYALTEHIEMGSIDVLAVQEIYVTHKEDGARKNKDLDVVMNLLEEHTDAEWRYELYENKHSGDKSQLCGLIWNASILNKLEVFKIPVKDKVNDLNLWDRTPHAVKFKYRHKTDFVIIPIHMKSNFGGATKAKKVRHQEAITLMENIDLVKSTLTDLDIVIIGDTNCLGSYEKALEVITDNEFIDLNESDAPTFVDGKAPFDRIFVPSNEKEFLFSRQYIMVSSNPSEHDKYLSDHFMIKTVMKIRRDDD